MDECFSERRYNAMIILKGIIDEDFVNYRVPSMVLEFPNCSFKCGKENCQNYGMVNTENIVTTVERIFDRYINNPITDAIVFQGLEPFDSWEEMKELLFHIRIHESCFDDIVIYTGYNKDEINDKIEYLKHMYSNIIIKYGRYISGQNPHYDNILGVKLASDNQYAERIGEI